MLHASGGSSKGSRYDGGIRTRISIAVNGIPIEATQRPLPVAVTSYHHFSAVVAYFPRHGYVAELFPQHWEVGVRSKLCALLGIQQWTRKWSTP